MKTILLSIALVLSTANAFAYPGQACAIDDQDCCFVNQYCASDGYCST